MSNNEKSGVVSAARIAWITGIGCVACCTLPLLGVAVGSTGIAGLALYSEKAAVAVAIIGGGWLVFRRLARRTGPACDIGAGCGPAKAKSEA